VNFFDVWHAEIQGGVCADLTRTLRGAEHDPDFTGLQKRELWASTEQERQTQNVTVEDYGLIYITDRDSDLPDR
jgi:hypothetical protein